MKEANFRRNYIDLTIDRVSFLQPLVAVIFTMYAEIWWIKGYGEFTPNKLVHLSGQSKNIPPSLKHWKSVGINIKLIGCSYQNGKSSFLIAKSVNLISLTLVSLLSQKFKINSKRREQKSWKPLREQKSWKPLLLYYTNFSFYPLPLS